jgi:IMP dehydrogenase
MDLLQFVRGCTFDDFLLTPQCGVLPRRDPAAVDLSARFSEHLTLQRPLVSANMDTVTRAAMATVLAEEGGIGVIDRGFRAGEIAPQVREVEIVKRRQHGVIVDPYTIGPEATLRDAAERMRETGVGTLVVIGDDRVRGILTARDLRFVSADDTKVETRMTPRERLVVSVGEIDGDAAAAVMRSHKVKKIPLVDRNGGLIGLMTAKDVLKHLEHPFATRDAQGSREVAGPDPRREAVVAVVRAADRLRASSRPRGNAAASRRRHRSRGPRV